MVMTNVGDSLKPILQKLKEMGYEAKPETQKEREARKKEEDLEILKEFLSQEKNNMFRSSLVSDANDLKSRFEDFKTNNEDQARYLREGKRIANEIYCKKRKNYVFTGRAGAGKTMLAVCILNGLNEKMADKTCLFVSVPMLINIEREAINSDLQFIKDKAYNAEKRIQKCDFLVLDDLGSEASLTSNIAEASDFIQRTLFRIADYRKNKANIITTNNTSSELRKIYNEKITSRLLTNNLNNVIQFSGKDVRIETKN